MIFPVCFLLAAVTFGVTNADDENNSTSTSGWATHTTMTVSPVVGLLILGLCILACCTRNEKNTTGFRTFENDERPRSGWRNRRFFRRNRRPNYQPQQTHVVVQPIVQICAEHTHEGCPPGTAHNPPPYNEGHSNPSFMAGSTYIPHMQPAPPYEKF